MFRFVRFSLLVCFLSVFLGAAAQQIGSITLINPSDVVRNDELIVVNRTFLKKKLITLGNGKYITVLNGEGQPVVVQFDDRDGDEEWDEAAFLYSFQPKERVTLRMTVTNTPPAADRLRRAHVRLRKKIPTILSVQAF